MLTKEDLSVYKVTSKDTTRPVLTCVLFQSEKQDNQWYIKLVATDGYRLTKKLVPVDYEPTFKELLIPAPTIQDLCKQLNNHRRVLIADGQFQILSTLHNPEGVLERTISMGETVEGKYPEHDHLAPNREPKAVVSLNPKYVKEAAAQHGDDTLTVELNEKLEAVALKSTDNRSVETVSYVMPLKA